MVKEANPWDYLRLALFPPLGYLRVDLLAQLRLDLARVASKES